MGIQKKVKKKIKKIKNAAKKIQKVKAQKGRKAMLSNCGQPSHMEFMMDVRSDV